MTYGKGNSEYSPLCDSQYVLQTCVNGQLLICMPIERLFEELPYIFFLQANTDGITVKIKRSDLDQLKSIIARWEKYTNLEMEYAYYQKMIINNVNNYIGVYEDGGCKYKGLFVYKDLDLHKDWSMLVVPHALHAYFVEGKNVEDFIYNYTDMYNFFKRAKIQREHKLVGRFNYHLKTEMDYSKSKKGKKVLIPSYDDEIQYQNVSRYYVSKEGVALFKLMPPIPREPDKPRTTAIEANRKCTVVNVLYDNIYEEMKQNLDYNYYIEEVYKIINAIENHEEIKNE